MSVDEDSVVCDLAETYSVFDYEGMQPSLVASLVFGLSENSRIRRVISKQKLTLEQMLLARICDELAFLSWTKTKDGQKNKNRPKSLLKALLGEEEKKDECNSYADGNAFQEAWDKIRKDYENGR